MKSKFILVMVVIAGVFATNVQANLITNGSFEDNDVKENTWRWFTANNVNGWSGSNIEIWDSFQGISATDGTQFAELNAARSGGKAFSILQTFDTNIGEEYLFSFAYRARRNSTEAFRVSIENENDTLFTQVMDDHVKGKWSFFNGQFEALSSKTTVLFSTIMPFSGTVGNFIDNVSVTGLGGLNPPQSVSAPAAAGLALLACFGLGLSRLRNKQTQ